MSKAAQGRSTPALSVASPDRRAVLTGASTVAAGALALGTGVAASAIAVRVAQGSENGAALVPIPADAELIEVGKLFDAAIEKEWAAVKELDRLQMLADERKPPAPAVKITPLDGMMFYRRMISTGGPVTVEKFDIDNFSAGLFWTPEMARLLSRWPLQIRHLEAQGEEWASSMVAVPEAQARADELIAIFGDWERQCRSIDEHVGTTAANDAWEVQYDLVHDLVDRIEAVPASSLAGLVVKARAAAWCDGELIPGQSPVDRDRVASAECLAWQIVQSLIAQPAA